MADAVSNVTRAAIQTRRVCERAKACRALVDVVERKMASLIPVMAEIQDHLEEMDTTAVMHLTTALAKDIRECRAIVQRASTMSKISYIVHSNDLREQIERNLRAIHLALMSLQASQNTYLIHQNQRLADEFRKFHMAWQQREKELRREKERESRLKARVAKSLEECNQRGATDQDRRESVAKAAGIRVSQAKWLEKELARARADHDRLVVKMKRDKDTVARSKAKADAMLMDQIITALAINESINTSPNPRIPLPSSPAPLPPEANHTSTSRRDLPEDCFCPITNQVMEDPIIVDAQCHHTLSRQAAQQWYGMGKSTCPVCGIEVASHHLSPNVQVRNITDSLLSDGVYRFSEKDRHLRDSVAVTIEDTKRGPEFHSSPGQSMSEPKRESGHHLEKKPRSGQGRSKATVVLAATATIILVVAIVLGLLFGLKPGPKPEPSDSDGSLVPNAHEENGVSPDSSNCGSIGDEAQECGSNTAAWGGFKLCCGGLVCDEKTNTCGEEINDNDANAPDSADLSLDLHVLCEEAAVQHKRCTSMGQEYTSFMQSTDYNEGAGAIPDVLYRSLHDCPDEPFKNKTWARSQIYRIAGNTENRGATEGNNLFIDVSSTCTVDSNNVDVWVHIYTETKDGGWTCQFFDTTVCADGKNVIKAKIAPDEGDYLLVVSAEEAGLGKDENRFFVDIRCADSTFELIQSRGQSDLCLSAIGLDIRSQVVLRSCDADDDKMLWKLDYENKLNLLASARVGSDYCLGGVKVQYADDPERRELRLVGCGSSSGLQRWRHSPEDNFQLNSLGTNLCVVAVDGVKDEVMTLQLCDGTLRQSWNYGYRNFLPTPVTTPSDDDGYCGDRAYLSIDRYGFVFCHKIFYFLLMHTNFFFFLRRFLRSSSDLPSGIQWEGCLEKATFFDKESEMTFAWKYYQTRGIPFTLSVVLNFGADTIGNACVLFRIYEVHLMDDSGGAAQYECNEGQTVEVCWNDDVPKYDRQVFFLPGNRRQLVLATFYQRRPQ